MKHVLVQEILVMQHAARDHEGQEKFRGKRLGAFDIRGKLAALPI